MSFLYVISIVYGVAGIIYLVIALRGILRKNSIKIIDLIKLMYSFVYGFIPCLVYLQEANGARNLYFYDYSSAGVSRIALMLLFSIAAYAVLNVGYYSIPRTNMDTTDDSNNIEENEQTYSKHLLICGTIALLIGWISLYLWTRAYGSISNFILYASTIRSGRGTVYNSFAFMKQFVRIMPLSLYAFCSAYCYERPKHLRRLFYFALITVSIIGNYFYFMASDSRVTIIFSGLAVLAISLRHRKKPNIRRYLISAAIISFVLLEATMLADSFTRYMRFGYWSIGSEGIIANLTKEFRFILSADMKAIKAWSEGNLQLQIGNDILNAITSWVPERFVPFSIPDTLWTYNTNLYGATGSGTSPSALVSTSIYELGLIGPIVFPFIFGRITGRFERVLWSSHSIIYSDVYYGVYVGLFIQMISHNQISGFVRSLFPVFLFFVITKFVENVRIGGLKLG